MAIFVFIYSGVNNFYKVVLANALMAESKYRVLVIRLICTIFNAFSLFCLIVISEGVSADARITKSIS